MKIRRIINDISFNRFIRELVDEIKKHPNATLENNPHCGDREEAESAFMFSAVIVYEE